MTTTARSATQRQRLLIIALDYPIDPRMRGGDRKGAGVTVKGGGAEDVWE